MQNMTDETVWERETLKYYREKRDSFFDGTVCADMEATRNRFLSFLVSGTYILDFGCGSGRDTKAFLNLGYKVDAADGSAELCRRASEYTGVPVRQMLFNELEAVDTYDGIWACASILHLPKPELNTVLHKISIALKDNGILYTSFKYGTFEGMRNNRYFTDFTEKTLIQFWKSIEHLTIIEQWITQDVRVGREDEKWINILARRI